MADEDQGQVLSNVEGHIGTPFPKEGIGLFADGVVQGTLRIVKAHPRQDETGKERQHDDQLSAG